VQQAGRIYRHIASHKGEGQFVTEVSMDESDQAQGPVELLLILAALADEGVPAQTIAPKFSGRFNKGWTTWATSAGSTRSSRRTWRRGVRQEAIRPALQPQAERPFGSDKFSIYPPCTRP